MVLKDDDDGTSSLHPWSMYALCSLVIVPHRPRQSTWWDFHFSLLLYWCAFWLRGYAGTNKAAETRNQSHPPLLSKAGLFSSPKYFFSKIGSWEKASRTFSDWTVKDTRNVTLIYKRKRDPVDASTDIIELVVLALHFKEQKTNTFRRNDWITSLKVITDVSRFTERAWQGNEKEYRNHHVCRSKIRLLQINNLTSPHR